MFWLFELYDSVLKLAPEILPVRLTQRISDMGRNFNIFPIEIGESLKDAFLCSMIKAIGLLLWRFRFRPITINRIQPAFFVGKHHVEKGYVSSWDARKSDWRAQKLYSSSFWLNLKRAMFGKKLIRRQVKNEIKCCEKQIAVSRAFGTENIVT